MPHTTFTAILQLEGEPHHLQGTAYHDHQQCYRLFVVHPLGVFRKRLRRETEIVWSQRTARGKGERPPVLALCSRMY